MGTVRVTVTDSAGNATSHDVDIAEGPQPRLLVGWCPPNSTVADLTPMLAQFPATALVRLFSSAGLPSWTSGILPLVAGRVIHVSIKSWPVDVAGWLTSRPQGLPPFYFTLDHEPEQQDGGDPTPPEYTQEWQQLIAALIDHPRRDEILLTPVYTEYAATKGSNASTWYANFGAVSSYEGIDAVGFDIYNSGYPSYRSPAQMFDFALDHARSHSLPLVVAEWGIERKTSDPTGTVCAQLMRDQAAYAAAQPEFRGLMWFYRGGDHLGDRIPERQALEDLIAEYGG